MKAKAPGGGNGGGKGEVRVQRSCRLSGEESSHGPTAEAEPVLGSEEQGVRAVPA